ncbi:toxin-antitoxin system YwqK family antitoxin [Cytophaga sp.]|uniref:toxin-antitoxin system YwqK family antitoxin n=1 Tax=Cytophaga sp. TaxID=29535 RepID=UPI003F7E314F
MLKKINLTFLVCLFYSASILAQNINIENPDKILMNRIYVQYSDSIIETYYYSGDKKIKEKDNLVYYWYAANDIKRTQGAYEGKILHGKCVMFYNNKDLLAKGMFKYGVKTGIWRYWYKGGKLKSKEIWKDGLLTGVSFSYDKDGNLQAKKTYKKGKLNGWVYYYDSKGLLSRKECFQDGKPTRSIVYTINDKGKAVAEKEKKEEKADKEEKAGKKFFFFKRKPKEEKPAKTKKERKSKIKIQRYHQVSPGGQGA